MRVDGQTVGNKTVGSGTPYGAAVNGGTQDTDAVAALLAGHFAAGGLSVEEFRARLDATYAATTAGELARLTSDLTPMAPRQGARWAGAAGPAFSAAATGARLARRRLVRRFVAVPALLTLATALFLSVIAVLAPHGVLLAVVLGLVVLPVLAVAALAGAVAWLGHRAWRRAAWLEAVPMALGVPWLSRVVWVGRAVLAGRALWRVAAHRRSRAGRSSLGYQHDSATPAAGPGEQPDRLSGGVTGSPVRCPELSRYGRLRRGRVA